jgi:hypothetical protein
VAVEHALGKAHMECDTGHDWAVAVQQVYQARLRASTASHQCSLDFNHVLSGHPFTLSV